jgi:DNA polymerase III subunit epsilon
MKLTLTRPLVFFDLETTGTDIARDRIVQFALLKLHPSGKEEIWKSLVNPTIPIPPSASAIHHITNAEVAKEKTFVQLAADVVQFFDGADIAGFNSNRFDLPLLIEELARCGKSFPAPDTKMVDAQRIYHRKEERTLSAAYRFYCGKTLEGAHDAEADIRATKEVFLNQIERYDDIGTTVEEIQKFCGDAELVDPGRKLKKNDDGEIVYNFGKHRGKTVASEPDYAEWMLKSDFPDSTKAILRKILKKS